jgi:hypothetical protein
MKTINLIIGVLFCVISFVSCSTSDNKENGNTENPIQISKPLNISVFLDMSDRIIKKSDGMFQNEKDTIIVEHIAKTFQSIVFKNGIQKSNDRIKVFFYPTPTIPEINNITKSLEIDFSKLGFGQERKNLYNNIVPQVTENLKLVYESTLKSKQWIGSDIWGFFDERAKDLCVQEGYRNILIILSDGYIYHVDNKQKEGNNFSYITPQTLSIANSGLIPCDTDLKDLEVLFLEVDAPVSHRKKVIKIIEDWFDGMSIEKYKIVKTDQPANNIKVIENFLNE